MGSVALVRAWQTHRPALVLLGLGLGSLLVMALFMTLGAKGNWGFVLPFRGAKLATLALVGSAVGLSTVLFQTITRNRILTPAVMGFDALYIAVQTALVFFAGAQAAATLNPWLRFGLEAAAMMALALVLFRLLFNAQSRTLDVMVLAGIVCGVMLHSLARLAQRLLDPNEFSVLQDMMFASFNSPQPELLLIGAVLIGGVMLACWPLLSALDVLVLGRETAIGLGVAYHRMVLLILALTSLLVAISTALAGPVTFLGLLVANLAHYLLGADKHRHLIPAAMLLGIIMLTGGQVVLERALGLDSALRLVIEFLGGLLFIALLLRGSRS